MSRTWIDQLDEAFANNLRLAIISALFPVNGMDFNMLKNHRRNGRKHQHSNPQTGRVGVYRFREAIYRSQAQNDLYAIPLALAAETRIRREIQEFALEEANEALVELKTRRIRGAKVLRIE